MKAVSRAGLLRRTCVALWLMIQPGFAVGSAPSDVVRGFYQSLLYNMHNGSSLGQQGRSAKLAPVVPRVFDIPYMTQLAIGPAWTTLPEPQRQQVMQAFERYARRSMPIGSIRTPVSGWRWSESNRQPT